MHNICYQGGGKGWTLVTSLATKYPPNALVEDVGLLTSNTAYKSLNNIESTNSHMMGATFNSNSEATIISCCSPTNVSSEEGALAFYDQLMELMKRFQLSVISHTTVSPIGTVYIY